MTEEECYVEEQQDEKKKKKKRGLYNLLSFFVGAFIIVALWPQLFVLSLVCKTYFVFFS